jgi:exopolyphosphatase/pppGpp-phosphohydrolase
VRRAPRPGDLGSPIAAAIDLGSNSVHLLVAAVADGRPTALRDESELLGLGAVVDLEGMIPEPERHAAIDALSRYVALATADGADPITLLATEPLRRAANRSRFCEEVEDAVGRPLHVLSHEEEALLTLLGVTGGEEPADPTLVVDIGGGSTEVIIHAPGEDPLVGVLPVGSARLTGAFIEDDPPTPDELAAVRGEARRLAAGLPVAHPVRGVVVGGSGRNLVRLVDAFDGPRDPAIDTRADGAIHAGLIERAFALVAAHPASELLARSGLRERRIRQMAAGAALIEAVLLEYDLDRLAVSDASLREGAIVAIALAGDAWREHLGALGRFRPTGPVER